MKLFRLLSGFFVVALLHVDAHANWVAQASSGGQPASASVSGVVVAYADGDDVIAKQYNPSSTLEWTATLASSGGEGKTPVVIEQGNYYFVAWLQPTGHTLKIARLDMEGDITATATLDSSSVLGSTASSLCLIPRGDGGIAVGWVYSGIGYVRMWASDLGSTHVSAKFNDSVNIMSLVSDDDDGVIAVWNHSAQARSNRLSATGTKLWSNPTVLIDGGYTATEIAAVKDGAGGAVVAAVMGGTVWAQRVDDEGTTYWDDSYYGTPVCDGTCGLTMSPQVVVNSSENAAVIAWKEYDPALELKASKLLLSGSWSPQWTTGGYPWIRILSPLSEDNFSYSMAAGADDKTKFARSIYDDGANTSTLDYTVVNNDGTLGPYGLGVFTQTSVTTPGDAITLSQIVDCDLGAYIPIRFYDSGWKVDLIYQSYPITNVTYSFNPTRCRTSVVWNTLGGTTANKLQYRDAGGSTWTTNNASGSNGSYTSSFEQLTAKEFRLQATLGGVVYSTKVYLVEDICDDPDPQGAPIAQSGITEAFVNAHPNPFNPQVTIDYGLPVSSNVTLSIFDVAGREVKSLVTGSKPAGQYSITWRGDNDRGEAVSSGVYFSRLTANGKAITTKLVMLK